VISTHCDNALRGYLKPVGAARGIGFSSAIGNRESIHEFSPPCRGRTRVMPFRFNRSATRALVASLGQEQ